MVANIEVIEYDTSLFLTYANVLLVQVTSLTFAYFHSS